MPRVPGGRKILHITHPKNLSQIVRSGVLWSDARRIELGLACRVVGMSNIKRRRLEELDVHCHPGTRVGEYVPFYFCPRSIMLFILYKANHPELEYTGGQGPILHLQADLGASIGWADRNSIRWAFSDRNAGERVAEFYKKTSQLGKVNWEAVDATDFRSPEVKEGKQAEFLMYESFPWTLVEKIGTLEEKVAKRVRAVIGRASHVPEIVVESGWYF